MTLKAYTALNLSFAQGIFVLVFLASPLLPLGNAGLIAGSVESIFYFTVMKKARLTEIDVRALKTRRTLKFLYPGYCGAILPVFTLLYFIAPGIWMKVMAVACVVFSIIGFDRLVDRIDQMNSQQP